MGRARQTPGVRFRLLFLGLLLLAPGLWGADPDGAAAGDVVEETEGRGLLVRSVPPGAAVFIDGFERGLTPLILDYLAPGEYKVLLRKEGYGERSFTARLRGGSRLMLNLVLKEKLGQAAVQIRRGPGSPPPELLPLNPLFSVDGAAAAGPVLDLAPGWRTIRVRAFGWEDAEQAVLVRPGALEPVIITLRPAPFRLSGEGALRRRFNPGNAGALGAAELRFQVSAPGRGRLEIFDAAGGPVFSLDLGLFETWSQSFLWRGRDKEGNPLPEGSYTVRVSAEPLIPPKNGPPVRIVEFSLEIDTSLEIRPASLLSGKPGLLFAPAPETLPPWSFQVEGGLLFGRPPGTERPWEALPLGAALRLAPLEGLELAAAVNLAPGLTAAGSFAGSLRWAFLRPGNSAGAFPLGLALGLAGGWAGVRANPFGLDGGVELFIPASWRFGKSFSLVFCPALLWTGPRGYPEEPVPRRLLAGGPRFEGKSFSASLSLRESWVFSGGEGPAPGTLLLGAEVLFLPPPSNLVLTLSGGAWFGGTGPGAFGGLGIGVIY